jgi:hypothetical protein
MPLILNMLDNSDANMEYNSFKYLKWIMNKGMKVIWVPIRFLKNWIRKPTTLGYQNSSELIIISKTIVLKSFLLL